MKGSLSSYLLQRLDQECGSWEPPFAEKDVDDKGEDADRASKRPRQGEQKSEGESKENGDDKREGNDNESDDALASDDNNDDEIDIVAKRARFLKTMRDRFVNGKES